MTPYTVHAIHPDGSPAVIYLLARSVADALLVAAELFTDCTLFALSGRGSGEQPTHLPD